MNGCGKRDVLPPTYGGLLRWGDAATYTSHRLFLPKQTLAPEFSRTQVSPFPAINTTTIETDEYQSDLRAGFTRWRLPVEGLVKRPKDFSLEDLKRFRSRTQITQHNCEQGWSAIAEWTGVQLVRVLESVGMMSSARYVVFYSADDKWDSIDMLDATHPQTLLAYEMNGNDLPERHGAPVRMRVERQLGYKSMKFLTRIVVTDRLDSIEDGNGSLAVKYGYSWYAGI